MSFSVRIKQFPQTRVAAVEHRGDPSGEYATSAKLIAWRIRNRLPPSSHKTFGLHYIDARSTDPSEHRVDFCVATDDEIAPNPEGVIEKLIPGCRCAVARHLGSRARNLAAVYLWERWLPESGEQASGLPMIFHYINVGPQVKESDMLTDVYLPLL
jgi:AraC family transcriptional regulator